MKCALVREWVHLGPREGVTHNEHRVSVEKRGDQRRPYLHTEEVGVIVKNESRYTSEERESIYMWAEGVEISLYWGSGFTCGQREEVHLYTELEDIPTDAIVSEAPSTCLPLRREGYLFPEGVNRRTYTPAWRRHSCTIGRAARAQRGFPSWCGREA